MYIQYIGKLREWGTVYENEVNGVHMWWKVEGMCTVQESGINGLVCKKVE